MSLKFKIGDRVSIEYFRYADSFLSKFEGYEGEIQKIWNGNFGVKIEGMTNLNSTYGL